MISGNHKNQRHLRSKRLLIMDNNYIYSDLTKRIIKAYFKVYNTLGYGFLEKVYERALCHELRGMGMNIESQKSIKVFYNEIEVGDYYADIIVEGKVIIELKAAEILAEEHEFQLINYLKATDMEVGLLLNFGKNLNLKEKFLVIV